ARRPARRAGARARRGADPLDDADRARPPRDHRQEPRLAHRARQRPALARGARARPALRPDARHDGRARLRGPALAHPGPRPTRAERRGRPVGAARRRGRGRAGRRLARLGAAALAPEGEAQAGAEGAQAEPEAMTERRKEVDPAGPGRRRSGSGGLVPIRVEPMPRLAVALIAALVCHAAAANPQLPQPPQPEPNVRFWTRVYTEVDTGGGLIHDAVDLDVVYEVVRVPEGLSDRAREQRIEGAKDRYRAILRKLARGERTELSEEERRVLALWPEGTGDATFERAVGDVRFQLGQADKFRAGLARSANWADHIAVTLEQQGVPAELVALPHVESSFNPRAYSRVGAAGLWQFTRSTGKRYL